MLIAAALLLPGVAGAKPRHPRVTAPLPAVAVRDTTPSRLIVFGSDSSATDTLRGRRITQAQLDSLRRQPPPPITGFDQPHWVMLRSLVVPGWGQLHNGSWKKAVAIGGVESYFIARIIDDKRVLNDIDAEIATARARSEKADEADAIDRYNARSDKYVARQWWLGAVLAYSLLDAYIDAHFRNFDVNVDDDPALPPEARHAAGLRLSWQVHF